MWRVASDDTSGCNTRAGGSGALAWASILGSYSLFRQMAHVSAASRAAPQRGVCAGVRSAGAVGTGPRLAGWRAGGRAGGRAHRCKCPKTKTSRRSCAASATRSDAKPQAGLLPPPQGANAARAGGASAAPFLHDEAGPLLAVLLHVHLLIVRHSPRWKLPRCETPASGALRVGSGSRSFCARTAALREVCRDGTRPRARGSGSTRAVQTSGSTRSIYTSAMCGSGHVHSLLAPPSAAVLTRRGTAEMGAQP